MNQSNTLAREQAESYVFGIPVQVCIFAPIDRPLLLPRGAVWVCPGELPCEHCQRRALAKAALAKVVGW